MFIWLHITFPIAYTTIAYTTLRLYWQINQGCADFSDRYFGVKSNSSVPKLFLKLVVLMQSVVGFDSKTSHFNYTILGPKYFFDFELTYFTTSNVILHLFI